jgi:hypothetical protein
MLLYKILSVKLAVIFWLRNVLKKYIKAVIVFGWFVIFETDHSRKVTMMCQHLIQVSKALHLYDRNVQYYTYK